jgi:hypothetical protein
VANKLIVVDRNGYPWGKIEVVIRWAGGGIDHVWINEDGMGEFGGTGVISEIKAPGETIYATPPRVDGRTTCRAQSNKSH